MVVNYRPGFAIYFLLLHSQWGDCCSYGYEDVNLQSLSHGIIQTISFQASWFQILEYILIRRPKDLLGLQELVVGQNQQQVLCFWIKMKDDVALNIFFCSLKSKEESTFFTLFVWDMKILIFTKELPYYQSLLLKSFRSKNKGNNYKS